MSFIPYLCHMKILHTSLLFLLITLTGCYSEPANTNIPNKRVSFLIDTSLSGPDYKLHDGMGVMTRIYTKEKPAQLSLQGAYGVSGVLVVRTIDNYLCAFDLCCPYEAKAHCALQQKGEGDFFLHCPTCGSEFEVGNGTGRVNKGPAKQPLKYYWADLRGGEKYYVHN